MTRKFKTYLILLIASILTPYVSIIFFIRTGSLLFILPLLLLSLILLIVSTIEIRGAEIINSRKKYYWLIAIFAVVFFFFSYGFQLTTADWIFFKCRESKLTTFITEIKNYKKIKQMSDGQRFWKSINFTSIEPNISNVDTSGKFGRKYFLDDILERDGVDKEHYEYFRNLLIKVDLIGFTTLDDGTISFTIDGFLDNCYGLAYSETGNRPGGNDCGQIINWTEVGEHWYAWGTT